MTDAFNDSSLWTPDQQSDLGDLAGMDYADLVDSLRKDLQLSLATDVQAHTGNDSPAFQPIPSSWFGSNWHSFAAPLAARYWIDANGWVELDGLVQNTAGYGNQTAPNALILKPPAALIHPTQMFIFACYGSDATTTDQFVSRLDLIPLSGAGAATGFSAGQLYPFAGVGSNTGSAGSFINLHGIRWNPRS